MQFTESEIREILLENQTLKKDLREAREELEATGGLFTYRLTWRKRLACPESWS